MTKLNKFRPLSGSRQVMRVRLHWSYIFARNFSEIMVASHYLTKYQPSVCISKLALLELSSWRCCLLRKKPYVDFE